MKLYKVTGSITVEGWSEETVQANIARLDATGDAEVTIEEVGDAPTYETWKVTPAEAEAINEVLRVLRNEQVAKEIAEEVTQEVAAV